VAYIRPFWIRTATSDAAAESSRKTAKLRVIAREPIEGMSQNVVPRTPTMLPSEEMANRPPEILPASPDSLRRRGTASG
jgi:hypothetical protein